MKSVVIGNARTSVGELIGKGGEGRVYAVQGRPGLAVKIYDAGLRAMREDKVRAMVSEGLASTTELVAFPGDIVTDSDGTFVGFTMRLVTGYRPLHELYSPKSRQRHFPTADYRFIVQAAQNVASAVGRVHQTGCVIGDLNHSGVLIAQNATAALIDSDSFQFRLNGKFFPCLVGVPEFTPPELHGKNLATVVRTIGHDNFGVAVAIFQLLFMGRHPYAGTNNGKYISMSDSIAQHRFAYSLSRQSQTGTRPPPGALTLDLFPEAIISAFERAFGVDPAKRPSASEWVTALTTLRQSLSRCNTQKTHYFPIPAKVCVWCRLASSSGFEMFPDLSVPSPRMPTDSRGIQEAIREFQAYRLPTVADLLSHVGPADGASRALREAQSSDAGNQLVGWLMVAGAVAGVFFVPTLWIIWVGLGGWGFSVVGNQSGGRRVDHSPFVRAFRDADAWVQREIASLVHQSGLHEVLKLHSELEAAIAAYKAHDATLARELKGLAATREARQRMAYLDRFSIRGADISGVGPAKTAALMSFGVETAADVTQATVSRVPGFGDVLTRRLLDWRHYHESRFKYVQPTTAQESADERALRASFAAKKAKLETTIRSGISALRSSGGSLQGLRARAASNAALTKALETRAQAEYDLRALGVPIPASAVHLAPNAPAQHAPQPPPFPFSAKPLPSRAPVTTRVPVCPRCGSPMRRRSGRYGAFWGCSRYPRCKGTRRP